MLLLQGVSVESSFKFGSTDAWHETHRIGEKWMLESTSCSLVYHMEITYLAIKYYVLLFVKNGYFIPPPSSFLLSVHGTSWRTYTFILMKHGSCWTLTWWDAWPVALNCLCPVCASSRTCIRTYIKYSAFWTPRSWKIILTQIYSTPFFFFSWRSNCWLVRVS